MSDSRIGIINLSDTRLDVVRVMICQPNFDQMDHEKTIRLHLISEDLKNKVYLRQFLDIAKAQNVNLLVFSELTVPSSFVDELRDVSSQYGMYIIGGTHYKKTEKGYLSMCPIITPHGIFYTEKINPSPFETSSFYGGVDGVVGGNTVKLIRGSQIGDFAVTICLDYTDGSLKNGLGQDELDFLIVTAFNNKSDEFFSSMHAEVQQSSDGLYIIYSNTISTDPSGEGRSALFAFIDNCYKSEFEARQCTNLTPGNKVYEFKDSESYCIFDLDLKHKKPYLSKNAYSRSNVLVIEEDDGQMEARYQFQKTIGASDDKFKNIDKYYVKPKEYKEMMALLEREHVLVITGDAGIGKTYTAIHFLLEYYKKGYKPTWFYGMAKEDRDAQRTSLLNLEPQEKDVVYVEDPFGRTVFENRDELKTLFANLVERFKSSKSKLIITSREEVFKKFEQEILSGGSLEAYKQELNVRKPSYRKEDLKEIAKHYIKAYTNWSDNPKLVSIVNQGIEEQRLISPLMIYNLVKNHPTPVEDSLLQKAIINVRSTDLVTQFADEIRSLSHPAKILLYMVLLYGRRNIAVIRSMFPTVQLALLEKTKFEGSSFMFELKGQENHRIQRLGERIPVYRFSHPSYEEALIELSEKDSTCALINETCLSEIISYDSSVAAEVFSRFVIRYPSFLEGLIVSVISLDFENLKESTKLDLTRKMLASENRTFVEMAKRMYPVQRLVESIYVEDDLKFFELRIRSLSRRRGELANAKIAWDKVFTKDRISRLHPIIFIECYEIAGSLDDKVMEKIESNLQKADIIRKFILLPNDELRNRFELILSGTSYKGIYQDLKDKIPKDILDARHNKRKYAGVLKKYILLNSKPKGIVYLDKGAMKAVCRGAKLYPVGVVGVAGSFGNGDIIELMQEGKSKPILVMSELSSDVIDRYKGLRSSEIYELEDKLVPTTISRPYLWRYAGN